MICPWHYRPNEKQVEQGYGWEDNSLSNALAWGSDTFLPASWCGLRPHWTGAVVNYLWTDCTCCLCARFFFLGVALAALTFGIIAGVAHVVLWRV